LNGAFESGGCVVIEVADTGVGLTPDMVSVSNLSSEKIVVKLYVLN